MTPRRHTHSPTHCLAPPKYSSFLSRTALFFSSPPYGTRRCPDRSHPHSPVLVSAPRMCPWPPIHALLSTPLVTLAVLPQALASPPSVATSVFESCEPIAHAAPQPPRCCTPCVLPGSDRAFIARPCQNPSQPGHVFEGPSEGLHHCLHSSASNQLPLSASVAHMPIAYTSRAGNCATT